MATNGTAPASPASDDDARLVARALAGDDGAAEHLVRRHLGAAFAIALAVIGDRDEAEDVCQDAVVRALERLGNCRHPERFGAWLAEIVRNRAHNLRAYRRVRATLSITERSAYAPGEASDAAERSELTQCLQKALGALTEMQRLVVFLHDLQGYAHHEIAELVHISETSSRQHLFVARKRLRADLGPTLIEDYGSEEP
jgi:RNA polymerase sigma factor (sigma-70 family)